MPHRHAASSLYRFRCLNVGAVICEWYVLARRGKVGGDEVMGCPVWQSGLGGVGGSWGGEP